MRECSWEIHPEGFVHSEPLESEGHCGKTLKLSSVGGTTADAAQSDNFWKEKVVQKASKEPSVTGS